ncbi:MAG: hypothetical protein LBU33_03335 [Endomicrobium sp.]|nr:hypothetical protein [Endomicrobium sp.]
MKFESVVRKINSELDVVNKVSGKVASIDCVLSSLAIPVISFLFYIFF